MRRILIHSGVALLILCMASTLWAKNPAGSAKNESKWGRTVGLVAGAFGGVLLGFSMVDDDAINSDRNVIVAMVAGGVGGGVGGYFLGRAIDRKASSFTWKIDPIQKQQIRKQLVRDEIQRLTPLMARQESGSASGMEDPSLRPETVLVEQNAAGEPADLGSKARQL